MASSRPSLTGAELEKVLALGLIEICDTKFSPRELTAVAEDLAERVRCAAARSSAPTQAPEPARPRSGKSRQSGKSGWKSWQGRRGQSLQKDSTKCELTRKKVKTEQRPKGAHRRAKLEQEANTGRTVRKVKLEQPLK